MVLSGHLTFVDGFFSRNHGNFLFAIGVDGHHYTAQVDTGFVARLGHAEDNTFTYSRTLAQFQADAQAQTVLLTGAPVWFATITVPGQPYFFIGGYHSDGSFSKQIIFVRYKINSTVSVTIDGFAFYHYNQTGAGDQAPEPTVAGPRGAAVVNGRFYYTSQVTDNSPFITNIYPTLIDLPLTGSETDNTVGSWGKHSHLLNFSWVYYGNTLVPDGRLMHNPAAVFDAGNGVVGVMVCKDTGDAYGPALFGMTVTGGVCSAVTDLKAAFGFPFTDTGTHYDSTPSISTRDRYTLSNVLYDGTYWEVIFSRTFSDKQQYARTKRFRLISLFSVLRSVVKTYQHTSDTVVAGSAESVQYRREGDTLVGGLRINNVLYWGNEPAPVTDLDAPPPAYTVPCFIGLAYDSRFQLLRPDFGKDAGAANGPAFGKKRRLHWYSVAMYRSRSLSMGTIFGKLHPLKPKSAGGVVVTPPTLYSGIHTDTIESDYSFEGQIAGEQTRPAPGIITAIGGYLSTQDK